MCISVYIYVPYIYGKRGTHTYISVYIYTYIYMFIYTVREERTRIYKKTYIEDLLQQERNAHVYICICIYTHIYICVYIHIQGLYV